MPSDRRRSGDERGYLIVALVVAVALLGVMSGVAAQEWADVLRRDNEAEMIFRAQDIVRGIQRYRKAHGAPPTELKQLMEPGPRGEYFLRRLYEDPLVKDGKWGLLFVGPGGTLVDPSAEDLAGLGLAGQDSSGGNRGLGQGGLGQNAGRGSSGEGRDDDRKRRQDERRERFQSALNDPTGSGGPSGLPIAGVKTLCKDSPFRLYNGLPEYDQWLFSYFDLENAKLPGQANAPGSPGGAVPGRPGAPTPGGPGALKSGGGRLPASR
jgi:type II secretory pathway pseudopilin PulG